jgi:hypothetical protein
MDFPSGFGVEAGFTGFFLIGVALSVLLADFVFVSSVSLLTVGFIPVSFGVFFGAAVAAGSAGP